MKQDKRGYKNLQKSSCGRSRNNFSDFLSPKDIKNLKKLASEKQKYLKVIADLDRKIIALQKSTRTTIPQMAAAHNFLRMRFQWYYNWHLNPIAKFTHWLVFFLYVTLLPFCIWFFLKEPSCVQANTCDYPRKTAYSIVGEMLKSIDVVDDNNVWIVGDSGIYKFDGTIWFLQANVSGLNDIDMVSTNLGWAVGNDGKILKYNGYEWSILPDIVNWDIYAISAGNDTNIIAVGDSCYALHSTDGGNNWTQKRGATFDYDVLYDIVTLSDGKAYSVGTWDGGISGAQYYFNGTDWDLDPPSIAPGDYYRISASDNSNVWSLSYNLSGVFHIYKNTIEQAIPSGVINAGPVTDVFAEDENTVYIAAMGGMAKYNGAVWSKITSQEWSNDTGLDIQVLSNFIWILKIQEMEHQIEKFYIPAESKATQLLITLPGQTFVNGVGITGKPVDQKVNVPFTVKVYAVDDHYNLDTKNNSWVRVNPGNRAPPLPDFQLAGGPTYECGEGQINVVVGLISNHYAISVSDVNDVLNGAWSSSFRVVPGSPYKLYFPTTNSGFAGKPIYFAVGVKDFYDNVTAAESDIYLNISTSSGAGYFSLTENGAQFRGNISTLIPAGQQSVTLWYTDYSIGKPIITVSASGLISASFMTNISYGTIVPFSRFTLSQNIQTVGQNVEAVVVLQDYFGNSVSGKDVQIFSSRADDIITKTATNGAETRFNIYSQKAGKAVFYALDITDNIYLAARPILTYLPASATTIRATGYPDSLIAGTIFGVRLALYDVFGNLATNADNTLLFSSSDTQAVIPASYVFSPKDAGDHQFNNLVLKTAGEQNISIFDKNNYAINCTINVQVLAGAPSAFASYIKGDKSAVKPDGQDTAIVSVFITDNYKNRLFGKEVELFSNRAEDQITRKDATTFAFASRKPGFAELKAYNATDGFSLESSYRIRVYDPAFPGLIVAIQQNPTIQHIARTLAPIASTVATIPVFVQLLQAIPQAFHVFASLFPTLFTAAVARRKRKPWGIVFDALTGQPIDFAIVRAFEARTGRLVQTKVTDENGRFSLLLAKGDYYVTVAKSGFIFPMRIPKIKAIQLTTRFGPEADIYLGQVFSIKTDDTNINLNIPLDPVLSEPSLKLKARLWLKNIFDWSLISLSYASLPCLLIGAVLAALANLVHQSTFNLCVSAFYIVLLSVYLAVRRIQKFRIGFVFDSKTKKPIPKAVISVFDKEYKSIRDVKITDSHGHFSILLQKGQYYLTFSAKGYRFPSKIAKGDYYFGETIKIKTPTFLNVSVPLDKD